MSEPHQGGRRDPLDQRASLPGTGPPTIDSSELFRGSRELVIRHAGSLYRLMITRQNKLILTK